MFNTNIPIYGVMILLALVSNVIIVLLIYKKYSFTKEEIIGAIVYENIGIILGAKIFSFIENYKLYKEFDFIKIGLSSYGAVIGAVIFLVIFSLQFKKSIKEMLFTFMPSIPLMYAIGKIGCFLVGCCHGIEYSGPLSISYKYSLFAKANIGYFPIQIVESIVFILIFIYAINKAIKNRFNARVLSISCILCGFSKFILEYLRFSHNSVDISLTQIIGITFIFAGLVLWYIDRKDKKL